MFYVSIELEKYSMFETTFGKTKGRILYLDHNFVELLQFNSIVLRDGRSMGENHFTLLRSFHNEIDSSLSIRT